MELRRGGRRFCRGNLHLPFHHRTDRVFLGLRRVHRIILQTGSGTPPRKPGFPVDRPLLHDVHGTRASRSDGECHERTLLRSHHFLPVPDHRIFRPQNPGSVRRKRRIFPRTSHRDLRQRRCGRPGLLFLRYLLVLCGGRGGVRHVISVHGHGLLGYDQMVRAGRPALRQSLDRADFLPDGAFHRDSSAEPARHSRPRVPVLLQDAGRQALLLLGICQDSGDLRRDPGFYRVPAGSAPAQDRRLFRPVLRKYARFAVQYGRGFLHDCLAGAVLLGTLPELEERTGVLEHRLAVFHDHYNRVFPLQHRDHSFKCQDPDERIPAG